MTLHVAGALGRTFRGSSDPAAYREALRRHQLAETERRERREKTVDDNEAEQADLALAVMVTTAELDAFRLELDSYDTATVMALERNEIELKAVRERMDELLAEAHVLPDGRRVFKTRDGLRVFDENGLELDAETIEPATIDDARPDWEDYQPEFETKLRLEEERRELLLYQEKLDAARERVDGGDISRDDLDALKSDLLGSMPDAVRVHVPNFAQQDASVTTAPSKAEELDISDDMVPTAGAAPRPSV